MRSSMTRLPAPTISINCESRSHQSETPRKLVRLSTVESLKNRIQTLEGTIEKLYADINAKDKEIQRYELAISCQKAKIKYKLDRENIGDGNFESLRDQNQILNEKLRNQEILLEVRTKFIDQLMLCDEAIKALVHEKEEIDHRFYELECEMRDKDELIEILRKIIAEKVVKLEKLTSTPTRDCC